MKTEKSCGAVVFTREAGRIRYLLICSRSGIYGFPKGHMEAGECEQETAAREILEEVGLRVQLLEEFRRVDRYEIPACGVTKEVVFFLAEFEKQNYCFQASEISGGGLYPYAEAMKMLSFDSSRRILSEANGFLMAK